MNSIPAIAPLCLWWFAACGTSERSGQALAEKEIPVAAPLGHQPADIGVDPNMECETGISGPDTGNVLDRNEIRTWARPAPPSGLPCGAGSSSDLDPISSSDTVDPGAGLGRASAAGARDTHRQVPSLAGAVIPLVRGLILLSAHSFPDGDRENMLTVTDVSPDGVMYEWSFNHREQSGKPVAATVERFVRATDFASAPRLNPLFTRRGRSDAPGYTAFSISRGTYSHLREQGKAPYTVVSVQSGPLSEALNGAFMTRVTLKGTLALVSAEPESMPVLLNGRRVTVPALKLRGQFAFQDRKEEGEYWVLADSLHPVLLRTAIGADTLQTISIEVPGTETHVERQLETVCRVELPGVYFAFASAELQPASEPALVGVADLLKSHPDWSFAIEGHTDSIGDPATNHDLSVRRAQAVRTVLVERYRISSSRLQAAGFGAARPREPNATIEGRARNRRVELVRDCAGKQD